MNAGERGYRAGSRRRVGVLCACLCAAVLPMSGCEAAGFFAQVVAPNPPPLQVKAEYLGLANQSVAVVVDANQALLFDQPLAPLEVSTVVSEQLAANVPGITLVDPKEIVDFQNRNIYWNTMPPSEIAKRLGVTRVVLLELTEYRLHEPGNVNIWRGVISGHVSVIESDAANPDNRTYDSPVTATYPPGEPLGVLNANQREIRFGTLDLFSRSVSGKFYDHKEAGIAE